jgi:hypothetical protein
LLVLARVWRRVEYWKLAFRLAVEYRTNVGRNVKGGVLFEADAGDRLFGMAKKKVTPKKKVGGKKKANKKTAAPKKKVVAKKVAARRGGSIAKKVVRGAASTKSTARKVRAITAEIQSPMKSSLGGNFGVERQRPRRGMGSESGGQSGDTEGISRDENFGSESVEELLEEGQSFEAEAVSGVENARDADQGEVTTHEVLQDDVPDEYGGEN